MKKLFRLGMMICLLAGMLCMGGMAEESPVGLWYMESAEDRGVHIDALESGIYIVLEIREDSSATLLSLGKGTVEEKLEGFWQEKDGQIAVTVEGQTIMTRMENGLLVFEEDNDLVEYLAPLSRAAVENVSGYWMLDAAAMEGSTYTPETEEGLILCTDWTAQYWTHDAEGNLKDIEYGNWQLARDGRVFVTIEGATVSGDIENRRLKLENEGRVLVLKAPDSYRENGAPETVTEHADILGSWKMEGAIIDGEFIAAADRGMVGVIVLHEDGTVSGSTALEGEEQGVAEGSWRWAGDQLGITLDGEEVFCRLVNGKLIAHYDAGAEMVFGR